MAEAWRLLRAAAHRRADGLFPSVAALAAELESLRDYVVHNSVGVTPGRALQSAALAQRVIDAIEQADRRQGRQERGAGPGCD